MKKKISLKLFCTVVCRGVWQVVCWIGSLFGIKDGAKLMLYAKRIFMVSAAVIALFIAGTLVAELIDTTISRYERSHDGSDMVSRIIGEDFTYYTNYWQPGFVRNNATGQKVLEDIIWLRNPASGDSLAVFKTSDDKRGYFNIYTGKVQVQPKFSRAWIFSGGLASVMKDGRIIFINSRGEQAFDKAFCYPRKTDGYAFHGKFCAVESNDGKVGLIDKTGEWVLAPEYDFISPYDNKWWTVTNGNMEEGVINDSLEWVLPVEYHHINFSIDGDGIYASKDGQRKRFDMAGNVVENFVVTGIKDLMYDTEELDDNGNIVRRMANCRAYSIDYNHEGLLSLDGKPLTKAIYLNILAISPNLFKAEIESGESILLDDKGNIVNQ